MAGLRAGQGAWALAWCPRRAHLHRQEGGPGRVASGTPGSRSDPPAALLALTLPGTLGALSDGVQTHTLVGTAVQGSSTVIENLHLNRGSEGASPERVRPSQ